MTCITYVVVFGLDGNGRPHAACFAEHDAALAIKAARYLGYRSLQIADAGLAEVLPRGNVFASRIRFATAGVLMSTSTAGTRPSPSLRRTRVWAIRESSPTASAIPAICSPSMA